MADPIVDRERLNSVRGLACLLLVANHSVAGAVAVVGPESLVLVTLFEQAFAPIRMPLFSILSGFIYAMRPIGAGKNGAFLKRKIGRLLIPYFTTAFAIIILKNIVGHKEPCRLDCMAQYAIYPYNHLWFIQSIFIIFLITSAVDRYFYKHTERACVFMLIFSCALYFSPLRNIDIFSIGHAFYLAPYFLTGVVLHRHLEAISNHFDRIIWPAIMLCVMLFSINFYALSSDGIITHNNAVELILGMAACTLLLIKFPASRPLTQIGVFSYSIYLYHTVFVSLANQLTLSIHAMFASMANRLTVNIYLLFALSMALGVFGPICIELAIRRYAPFLGFVIGERLKMAALRPPFRWREG
ncbi:Fucose 4-O-acetylase [Sphingomonas laterariae]|uniref:Fucose 4-O-acetylase n=1 Tax=Edaphosphingomonas laterariae TaxID=861865 RepID=A0A239HVR3_9SPHN|nr:acyltransferase [Sphingomonas laterariae]SNS85405.1 Fucose 4-O-acetylase [Sphingomonas laterariae]